MDSTKGMLAPWIDAVQVPLAVVDASGRILAINHSASARTGRGQTEWLGRQLEAISEAPGGRLRWSFAPMPGEPVGLKLATGTWEPQDHLEGARRRHLRCLYRIGELRLSPDLPVEMLFEMVAEAVCQALQYPELARVRVAVGEQLWEMPGWVPSSWRLSAGVPVAGGDAGQLEVIYLEPRPTADSGPFLAEERALLDHIGRQLGALLDHLGAVRREQEREAQLDEFLNLTDAIMLQIAPDGRLLRINAAAEQVIGQPLDRLLGEPALDRLVPEDRLAAREAVRGWITERRAGGALSCRLLTVDGSTRQMHWAVALHWDREGHLLGLWAVGRDITEQKRSEEVRGRLAAALEAAAEAVWIADLDGTIRYVNPAFESITGYRSREVIGQTPRLLRSGLQEPEFYAELWRRITAGEPWTGRIVNRRKDGETYTAQMTIAPVRDAAGKVVEYIATQQDITAECSLQERVNRAATLEALGRLAAGISHDFNNILLAVMGYTELVLLDLGADHPAHDSLHEVVAAADRGAALVRQMMAFSRQEPGETEAVDVNDTIEDVRRLLRRMIGEDVTVRTVLAPWPLPILADAVRLHQVLINLAINARDAMPLGGELLFETALAPATEPEPAIAPSGQCVRITVRDTGCGMSEEVRARIFEPYFTTKLDSGGTGLGLATTHGIVSQLGGRVAVHSTLGEGSTFTIWLPLAAQPPQEAAAVTREAVPRGNGETILLVEDEASLRELLGRALTNHGYRVVLAADGGEAIEQMRLFDGEIDALLTDVIMPGMSGFELLSEVAETYPETRCLAMSGYADERLMQVGQARLIDRVERLSKPFSPHLMLRRMRELLDHAPSIGELVDEDEA